MNILKNLKFLDRDCIIINNIQKATKAYIGYNKDYFVEATIIEHHGKADMRKLVKDITALGKQLYECNKDKITKIKDNVSGSIEIFKYDYFIFSRSNEITQETADIIKEWCNKGNLMTFVNSYTNFDNEHKDIIDMYSLVDISIFMYLLFSAINNENIRKIDDYAKRRKLEINSNGISYKDIVQNYIDEHYFYARVISYINFYENNVIDTTRPIFKETTRLYLEEKEDSNGKLNYKPKLVRCFENVYSFYIFVIKMAIYASGNGFSIVNMCGCGNVIDGKADNCTDCFKMADANRKNNQ